MSVIAPAEAPLRFPISASQQRCWFVQATDPEGAALNVALRWELTGPLRPELVEAAFNGVIARHESLRTRFIDDADGLAQEVAPALLLRVTTTDLRHTPEPEREAAAEAIAVAEGRKPFRLDELPLLRVHLVQMTGARAIILLTVHHIVFDGWSIRLIADEFGAFIAAIDEGREPELLELPLQYGDYALWQKESLAAHDADDARYWREQLAGAPYFEVAGDFPRPQRPGHGGVIIADTLSPPVSEQLELQARRLGVTPFALGYAATVAMLKCVSGCADISIGTQVAGREEPELEPMIGMFVNNVVLRVDTRHVQQFSELLARTGAVTQDALLRQRMSFHRLVELLNPPRDPARTPLVSVNFTVLKEVMDARAHGRFFLRGLPSLAVGPLYDLNLFIVKWPDGWRMALEYNSALFASETAQGILGVWREALERAIMRPDFDLDELTAPQRAPAPPRPALAGAAPALRRPSESPELQATTRMQGTQKRHGSPPAAMPVALAPVEPAPVEPAPVDVAPVDEALEAEVAAIWRDVLKARDVGPDAHFFDLGGHSLLAIRMLGRVRARFGQQIDPLQLFGAPTLRQFCALLHGARPDQANGNSSDHGAEREGAGAVREAASGPALPAARGGGEDGAAVSSREIKPLAGATTPEKAWRIVSVQPHGAATPVIVINNTMSWHAVARATGRAHPFIGVQLFSTSEPEALEQRALEDIAADYVKLIRAARPHGPYVLAGLCVAGVIAFEAARQLEAAGEAVPLVVMADTWRPNYLARLPSRRRARFMRAYRWRMLRRHRQRVAAGEASWPEVMASYPAIRRSGLLTLAQKLRLIGVVEPDRSDWSNRWFLPMLEAARDGYEPGRFGGRVVLLRSEEMALSGADDHMGWGPHLAQPPSSFDAPGWHAGVLQGEGADQVAEILRAELAALEEALSNDADNANVVRLSAVRAMA